MASGDRNPGQQAILGFRQLGMAAGLALVAIAVGFAVRAEPDEKTGDEMTSDPMETVELPVESIRLASDRLSLQDSLEVSASVVLPDSCHHFERLEGSVDEDRHVVTLVAMGGRQGEVCSQVLEIEETALLLYPLPSEGVWTVEAQHFDETIQVELTVIP